jgi:hypothetical protein
MITQRKQLSKVRRILLGTFLLLSIFSFPSFSAISQLKWQQVTQTELPLFNLQKEDRSQVYKNASRAGIIPEKCVFQTITFIHILSYNASMQTRFKHVVVQRRNFKIALFFISPRISSHFPDEEFHSLS